MRIVSKFSDYYDGVQAHGQDKSVLYVRKTEPLGMNHINIDLPGRYDPYVSKDLFDVSKFAILFCGKAYRGCKIWKKYDGRGKLYRSQLKSYDALPEVRCVYSLKDITPYSKITDLYLDREDRTTSISWWTTSYSESKSMDEFNGIEIPMDIHIKYKTPIIAEYSEGISDRMGVHNEHTEVYKDPRLKDFDFARIVDPYTAFQEIAMMVGGVIPKGGPPIVEVSNESKIKKHGLDKWSFRRPPTKRK